MPPFSQGWCLLDMPAVLQYLEWREKQYDLRVHLDVYSGASSTMPVITNALTYIATDDRAANQNWLGPATPEAMAQQISVARGPSGWNCEYLYNLAAAMKNVRSLLGACVLIKPALIHAICASSPVCPCGSCLLPFIFAASNIIHTAPAELRCLMSSRLFGSCLSLTKC